MDDRLRGVHDRVQAEPDSLPLQLQYLMQDKGLGEPRKPLQEISNIGVRHSHRRPARHAACSADCLSHSTTRPSSSRSTTSASAAACRSWVMSKQVRPAVADASACLTWLSLTTSNP